MIDELRYVLIAGCLVGILCIVFALVGLWMDERAFRRMFK
jgi:hypothetical protein